MKAASKVKGILLICLLFGNQILECHARILISRHIQDHGSSTAEDQVGDEKGEQQENARGKNKTSVHGLFQHHGRRLSETDFDTLFDTITESMGSNDFKTFFKTMAESMGDLDVDAITENLNSAAQTSKMGTSSTSSKMRILLYALKGLVKLASLGPSGIAQLILDYAVRGWLALYSLVQYVGWNISAANLIIYFLGFSSATSTWAACGWWVAKFTYFEAAEVIHAALGIVRPLSLFSVSQLATRVAFVQILNCPDISASSNSKVWPAMICISWCLNEVVRHAYHGLAKLKIKIFPLTWLRYSMPLVLYPVSVIGELGFIYYARPHLLASKSFFAGFSGWCQFRRVLVIYVVIFLLSFMHLVAQRKQVLGGAARERGATKPREPLQSAKTEAASAYSSSSPSMPSAPNMPPHWKDVTPSPSPVYSSSSPSMSSAPRMPPRRKDVAPSPSPPSPSPSPPSRKERLAEERSRCQSMKLSELRKELDVLGISTKEFVEKSEFVEALAETRVDTVTDTTAPPRSSSDWNSETNDELKKLKDMGLPGFAIGKAKEMVNNPEVMKICMKASENPKLMECLKEVMSNPMAMAKYQDDPEMAELMRDLRKHVRK